VEYARIFQPERSDAMTKVTVGTWGKSLAVRVPQDMARMAGLVEGEQVEIEVKDGDILIRRADAKAEARADALAALEEIIADRKGRSLAGVSIRELIDEGRK
jgi:antitoxin MazE